MGPLIVLLSVLLVGCGCSTSKPPASQDSGASIPAPVLTGTVERAAVCIGVLAARAPAYGQHILYCPGADVDIQMAAEKADIAGVTNIYTILSLQATWQQVQDTIKLATAGFGPEDKLLVSLSSHGGWIQDDNGDEPSGYDSTLCLGDGPVRDDDVWAFICTLPPCQITLLTDTCHAQGNWRWFSRRPDFLVRKPDGGGTWAGSLVQLAASTESTSALGGNSGGQWTTAFYVAVDSGNMLTVFNEMANLMEGQQGALEKYGPLADWMLSRRFME